MARKRMIDPEFWSDEKIAQIPMSARLLFIGLWNFADDEGVFKARPEFIKNNIFPYDDLMLESITVDVEALSKQNLVFLYAVHGQQFGIVLNFKKHQTINKPLPSKHPKPSIQNTKYQTAIFERDNWTCHLCGDYLKERLVARDGLDATVSLDHIIPVSKGGNDLPSNLLTACLRCNKSRGNKPLPDNYRSATVPNEMKGNEMNSNEGKGTAFEKATKALKDKKTIRP